MKALSLMIVLLALPLLSWSQKRFDYKVSTPYKVVDSPQKYYFSSTNNDIILGVKREGRTLSMQRFDAKSMEETKRTRAKDMPDGFVLEHMDWFGDRAYCYYSVWDRANTTEQLFVREIDVEKCAFKGEGRRLIAVKGKLTGAPVVTMYFWSLGTLDKFSFLKSHDGSKLLVQCRKKPAKRNDAVNYDVIGMYVFDEEHKELAGNQIQMPYTEQAMDNIDYHINSEGIPHILARVRADGSKNNYRGLGTNMTVNHHIELLRIDIPNGNMKVTKVEVDGYILKDMTMYDAPDNTMICSGYYTLLEPGMAWDDADGLFVFKMKEKGGIKSQKFYEIPLDVINQYQKKGAQNRNAKRDKKGKAQFADLEMREFIIQDDNSIIIIGEQYYIRRRTVNGQTYITYHYEDVLMTKIAPSGELAWMKKLPKKQYSSLPRGGLGFKYISLEDTHYLIFLDNVKNMELGLDKRPAVHADGKGGYLTAYGVDDADGKAVKISILDTKKVEGGYTLKQFSTGRIVQLSKDEFIFEAYKGGKQDVMVKVKIK